MHFLQVASSKSPFNEIMLSFPMRKAAASYLEGRKRGFSNRLSCICLVPTHRHHSIKDVAFERRTRSTSLCDTESFSMSP